MITINTDISALLLHDALASSTKKLNLAIRNMTTGYKLNNARDDAAGFSVASDLNKKISSWLMLKNNAEQGLSLLNTAEEGLNNIITLLERLESLSMQAAEGVYDDLSRTAMQAEADAIIEQIYQIKESTNYNGINLYGKSTVTTALTIQSKHGLSNSNVIIPNSDKRKYLTSTIPTVNTSTINNLYSTLASQKQTPDTYSTPKNTLTTSTPDSINVATPYASGDDITGAEDFASGETKTIVIDGVSYKITNDLSYSQTVTYIKNKTTGELTLMLNSFTVQAQDDVTHNLIINGKNNKIYGGAKNDTIKDYNSICVSNKFYGGDGDDSITARSNNTSVYGEEGNDTITVSNYANCNAGNGDDILHLKGTSDYSSYSSTAGEGNDTIYIANGYRIKGGGGNDTFIVTGNQNIIDGEGGTNTCTDSGTSNILVNVDNANAQVLTLNASETKVINIGGINYTIKNNLASTNSIYYSFDSANSEVQFKFGRSIRITGDANTAHKVSLKLASSSFYGGNLNDTIKLNGGLVNTIFGQGGDDSITFSGDAMTVYGGDGNDTIKTSSLTTRSIIKTGSGNNTVNVSASYSSILSGVGNDNITVNGTQTSLYDEGGTNTLTKSNNMYCYGFGSSDNCEGGVKFAANETQTITINGKTYKITNKRGSENFLVYNYNPVTGRTLFGGLDLTIIGEKDVEHNVQVSGYAMELYGGNLADSIYDYGYNNNIHGLGGNDNILLYGMGSYGYGESGDDTLTTTSVNNVLSGNDGDDVLNINYYTNGSVNGGSGNDIYNINATCTPTDSSGNNIYNITTNNVTVTGGTGDDTFYVKGTNNTVKGAGGNDYFVVDAVGNNTIDGGTGMNYYVDNSNNTAYIINATNNPNTGVLNFTYVGEVKTFTVNGKQYTVTNTTSLATPTATNTLTYTLNPTTGLITVNGSNFTIDSDNNECVLAVRGDNNVINGSDLSDRITIESGTNNQINGKNGDDTLISDTENNSLNGDTGNDTITVNATTTKNVTGGDGNDNIILNASGNTNINTGNGSDKVTGTSGSNIVNVGSGSNNLLLTGNDNKITAGDGNNSLSVVGKNNTITTGNGGNVIGIQGNNNSVTSGSGSDIFNINGDNNNAITTGGSNTATINGNSNNYQGGNDVDTMYVRGDKNTLKGGDADDKFTVRGGNDNYIDGEAGARNTLRDRGKNTTAINIFKEAVASYKYNFKIDIGKDGSSYIKGEISCDLEDLIVDLMTEDSARDSIDNIHFVMDGLVEQLAQLGAAQVRLLSIIDLQTVTIQNLISTRSTIKDADIAKESSAYIRAQILQQATATLITVSRNLRIDSVLGIINNVSQTVY